MLWRASSGAIHIVLSSDVGIACMPALRLFERGPQSTQILVILRPGSVRPGMSSSTCLRPILARRRTSVAVFHPDDLCDLVVELE